MAESGNARAICLRGVDPQLEIDLAGQPVTLWVMWVQSLREENPVPWVKIPPPAYQSVNDHVIA